MEDSQNNLIRRHPPVGTAFIGGFEADFQDSDLYQYLRSDAFTGSLVDEIVVSSLALKSTIEAQQRLTEEGNVTEALMFQALAAKQTKDNSELKVRFSKIQSEHRRWQAAQDTSTWSQADMLDIMAQTADELALQGEKPTADALAAAVSDRLQVENALVGTSRTPDMLVDMMDDSVPYVPPKPAKVTTVEYIVPGSNQPPSSNGVA